MNQKTIMILCIGVLSIIGALVVGEIYISHVRSESVSSEVLSIVKMSITGLLGLISGYVSGKKEHNDE